MLETVTEALVKILQHIWKALFTIDDVIFSDFSKKAIDTAGNYWGEKIGDFISGMLEAMSGDPDLNTEIQKTISGLAKSDSLGAKFSGVFYFIIWISMFIRSNFEIINADSLRNAMSTYTPAIPEIGQLLTLMWRKPEMMGVWNKFLANNGWSQDNYEYVKEAMKPELDITELTQLRHRGEISPEIYLKRIEQKGFTKAEAEEFEKLGWYIPSAPDLVRMAVREVFTPETVSEFGQMQDFPREFAEWGKKIGLSEEWAKNFWAAHWELPSVQMGYEMLHRGVIDDRQLDMLMKALDIMPNWRDKLKQISYRPYSRVDIRRMHALGVLSDSDVYTAYKDLGYDDDKAKHMQEFTLIYNKGKEKDLSKGEILDSFKKAIISERETVTYLQEYGYDDDEIDILIKRAKWTKETEEKAHTVSYIKSMYMHSIYNNYQAENELNKLAMGGAEVSDLLRLWDRLKQSKVRRLTPSQLIQMAQGKIIDPRTWREEMRALHFPEKYIDWMHDLYIDVEIVPDSRDLSISHIKQLYIKNVYGDKEAREQLSAIRIVGAHANDLIMLWDITKGEDAIKQAEKLTRQEESAVKELDINNIQKLFTAKIYTRNEALQHLLMLKLQLNEANALLTLWERNMLEIAAKQAEKTEKEIESEEKELTTANIKSLYLAGIYGHLTALRKLLDMGYSNLDAEQLLDLWGLAKNAAQE